MLKKPHVEKNMLAFFIIGNSSCRRNLDEKKPHKSGHKNRAITERLSYDMTVSSTAIVFTRYILIEWLRRKKNDDKTICELFYVCCDEIQDMELSTALKQLLEILVNGLKNQMITITSEIKSQLIDWFVSQPAFIQALCPDFGWEV